MVRWMCGASLKNRVSTGELNKWMGVVCVAGIVRQGRLRLFCHLEARMNGCLIVEMCL